MTSTSITSTTAAVNNPAITSKDVIEFREANMGFQGCVSSRYYDEAKVGTSIRWGSVTVPNSGSARTKSEGNNNTIVKDVSTESAITLTFNQYQYSAFELEEFEEHLSIVDQRMWYTKAAAYVVDLAIDSNLASLVSGFSQIVGVYTADGTDDDVRRSVQYLDDANAPADGRHYGMSPAMKNAMLGIDRYMSSDFNSGGGTSLPKGSFGQIYNLNAFQSTNVTGSNAAGHDNTILQQDAIALGMRMRPHTREFDDISNLSHTTAISTIYGSVETRDNHGIYFKGA